MRGSCISNLSKHSRKKWQKKAEQVNQAANVATASSAEQEQRILQQQSELAKQHLQQQQAQQQVQQQQLIDQQQQHQAQLELQKVEAEARALEVVNAHATQLATQLQAHLDHQTAIAQQHAIEASKAARERAEAESTALQLQEELKVVNMNKEKLITSR